MEKGYLQGRSLRRPKGAADITSVTKLRFKMERKDHVIECNEFDMNSNVKSLVSFVQKKETTVVEFTISRN